MRTVGQILKEEREKKFYSLEEIEKVTKIRKELLEALENDNFSKLPPPTFVQGFIKNYGKFLGLDSIKLLAVYRREFSDRRAPQKILESFTNPLDKTKITLTPAKVLSATIVCIVLIFFGYLWYEFRYLVGTPLLEISSPKEQETLAISTLEVVGKTNPEAKVLINNQEVSVDSSGNFSAEIKLTESMNKLTITATSKFGKTAELERVVYFNP